MTEFIPHAPKLGLYVRPSIPRRLSRNAIRDFAANVPENDLVALYDNTWLGNGKDGVVFTSGYLVFQNSDLNKPQQIWYRDIVHVVTERKRLGGVVLHMDVNTGRATITETMDFGRHPKAIDYVHRFIQEAMQAADAEIEPKTKTDWSAVRAALKRLVEDNKLTDKDFKRVMTGGR